MFILIIYLYIMSVKKYRGTQLLGFGGRILRQSLHVNSGIQLYLSVYIIMEAKPNIVRIMSDYKCIFDSTLSLILSGSSSSV